MTWTCVLSPCLLIQVLSYILDGWKEESRKRPDAWRLRVQINSCACCARSARLPGLLWKQNWKEKNCHCKHVWISQYMLVIWPCCFQGSQYSRVLTCVWIRAPTKSRKDQHDQFLQQSRNLVSTTSKPTCFFPRNVHKFTKAGFYGTWLLHS